MGNLVKLDKEKILKALALLDEKLHAQETIGEICIFGGAAMILAFDGKFTTRDVDAIFIPKDAVNNSISAIADEMNLPATWLNDYVKGFLSEKEDFTQENMPVYENLRVVRPSAPYLLAMKCLASRVSGYGERGDASDIKILLNHLEINTTEEVITLIQDYYPPNQVPAKTRFFVEELIQELNSETT